MQHGDIRAVVQHYSSKELEKLFGIKAARVIGFEKACLAQSLYAESKAHRINKPVEPSKRAERVG